jgi:hypothetical protein
LSSRCIRYEIAKVQQALAKANATKVTAAIDSRRAGGVQE